MSRAAREAGLDADALPRLSAEIRAQGCAIVTIREFL